MVSSVRPQRGSTVTSSTGARPWCTPTERMLVPICAGHLLDQAGVEAGPPGQRHRVDRRGPGGEPGQALVVGEGRDAEPAGRHDRPAAAGPAPPRPGGRSSAGCRRAGSAGPGRRGSPRPSSHRWTGHPGAGPPHRWPRRSPARCCRAGSPFPGGSSAAGGRRPARRAGTRRRARREARPGRWLLRGRRAVPQAMGSPRIGSASGTGRAGLRGNRVTSARRRSGRARTAAAGTGRRGPRGWR